LTPVDKENLFTVDHFPIWYRLAVENKPGQFFFYVPHDDINKGALILIIKFTCRKVKVSRRLQYPITVSYVQQAGTLLWQ